MTTGAQLKVPHGLLTCRVHQRPCVASEFRVVHLTTEVATHFLHVRDPVNLRVCKQVEWAGVACDSPRATSTPPHDVTIASTHTLTRTWDESDHCHGQHRFADKKQSRQHGKGLPTREQSAQGLHGEAQ